jgi:hypothetical protein
MFGFESEAFFDSILKTLQENIDIKIFSTWPLETTLWWNGPWVIPFQNCVRQSQPPANMVAVTKIKKGV